MLSRRTFIAHLTAAIAMTSPTRAREQQMLHRSIPASNGMESLPVIGMGTWNTFDVGPTEQERASLLEVLQIFYESGGRLIDSSPMYGAAERVTGELVAQLARQASTFYATKVWTRGREQGAAQIEQSMRAMRTRRLDLLQVHNLVDWRSHLPTLRSMKADGRVRYTGVTHYTVGAHDDLEQVLREQPFEFAQFNYSIATRAAEQRLLPYCQEHGVAVIVNRPFEEGDLFTRVRNRKLPGYAAEIGCTTWAQFFLKFIISHPAVTCVIPATSRPDHMRDNVQAGVGPLPDARVRERMAQDFRSG
jgi:diketogulonate reductase-like aldo/keto reductase